MEAWLAAAVRLATPLALAALGELLVQRAGVVNIGIEGMMLIGAFAGFSVSLATGVPELGVLAAAAAGLACGALFVALAVVRRADQIVVGMALNLLALGVTGVAVRAMWGGLVPTGPTLRVWSPPVLGELPLLGPVLFAQSGFVYGVLVLVPIFAWGLTRTRPGLRLRAAGESARAADAEGVRVDRVRGGAVLVGAALAGVAGAALSLSQSDTFSEGMTAGRGFIALAVVVFGRWHPAGVAAAALFFGAATALQFRLQARGLDLPYPVFLMLPYLLTLLVLAGASQGARGPADLGRPFRRDAPSGP